MKKILLFLVMVLFLSTFAIAENLIVDGISETLTGSDKSYDNPEGSAILVENNGKLTANTINITIGESLTGINVIGGSSFSITGADVYNEGESYRVNINTNNSYRYNEGVKVEGDSFVRFQTAHLSVSSGTYGLFIKESTFEMVHTWNPEFSSFAYTVSASNNKYGMYLTSGAKYIASETSLNLQKNEVGLFVNQSTVTIMSNQIAGINRNRLVISNNDYGLLVENKGYIYARTTTAEEKEVITHITNNNKVGVKLDDSTFEIDTLDISSNNVGLNLSNGAYLKVDKVLSVRDNTVGIEIEGTGNKISYGYDIIHLRDNGYGFSVAKGTFTLSDIQNWLSFENNTKSAIYVWGKGSNLTMQTSNIQEKDNATFLKTADGGTINVLTTLITSLNTESGIISTGKDEDGNASKIIFNNNIKVYGGTNETQIGLLAENGGQITANEITVEENTESGIEIRGGQDYADSKITFNQLTANKNKYGIKVSSGANFTFDNANATVTLNENTTAAIGVIKATMTINNLGTISLSGNTVGMVVDETGFVDVKSNEFSLNNNETNGIEIKGNSYAKFKKLQTNYNTENGIILEANSNLFATELEANNNDIGINLINNENVSLEFDKLTANNNTTSGISLTKSNWIMKSGELNFSGNETAIDIQGSTVTIRNAVVNADANDILMNITTMFLSSSC